MSDYTIDYFIEKFSAIPVDKWNVGSLRSLDGSCCVLGHVNTKLEAHGGMLHYILTEEGKALVRLITKCKEGEENEGYYKQVIAINDKAFGCDITPKQAIINTLVKIKNKNE
jgi:hypothetical protein